MLQACPDHQLQRSAVFYIYPVDPDLCENCYTNHKFASRGVYSWFEHYGSSGTPHDRKCWFWRLTDVAVWYSCLVAREVVRTFLFSRVFFILSLLFVCYVWSLRILIGNPTPEVFYWSFWFHGGPSTTPDLFWCP